MPARWWLNEKREQELAEHSARVEQIAPYIRGNNMQKLNVASYALNNGALAAVRLCREIVATSDNPGRDLTVLLNYMVYECG